MTEKEFIRFIAEYSYQLLKHNNNIKPIDFVNAAKASRQFFISDSVFIDKVIDMLEKK